MARSPVRLPVIRRVQIENYQLYPGVASKGLSHDFASGLHVAVGTNGLGKTTLLVALYRALIGPQDPEGPDDSLGATAHAMVPWRGQDYFRKRVADDAEDALITLTCTFGDDELIVARRLATLDLEALSINGKPIDDPTEDEYQDKIISLTGLGSFYDVWALARYLIFFLDDRYELVWNNRAQFELLRLLFSDKTAALETSAAQDRFLSADSRYRNDRAAFRRIARQYSALPGTEKTQHAEEEIQRLIGEIDDLESTDGDLLLTLTNTLDARKTVTLQVELQRIVVEQKRRSYEAREGLAIVARFPNLDETARLTFMDLITGVGCLVCGSRADEIGKTFARRATAGICPVCESLPENQEFPVITDSADSSDLEDDRESLISSEATLQAQQRRQRELEREYERLSTERLSISQAVERRRLELSQHQSILRSDKSASDVTVQYELLLEQLGNAKISLQALFEAYQKHIKRQERRIKGLSASIRRRFQQIASNLLAEDCTLGYDPDDRKVGQEANYAIFPRFTILMTSGVFEAPHGRTRRTDVSESQAEFIDIAFRMALIQEACGDNADAMFIIETPEASLDAVFANNFGSLLRSFAYKQGRRNVVIATSNLVSGPMLAQILKGPRSSTLASIKKRLINLLDLAAPTRALKAHRQRYNLEFTRALRDALK